jgi:hypothetical protein
VTSSRTIARSWGTVSVTIKRSSSDFFLAAMAILGAWTAGDCPAARHSTLRASTPRIRAVLSNDAVQRTRAAPDVLQRILAKHLQLVSRHAFADGDLAGIQRGDRFA